MSALSVVGGTRKTAPMPPWMQAMRDAVEAELREDDLQGIVRAFVDKAKAGDERAAKFVIEYLMGAKMAPTEITVNNHYHGEGQPTRTVEVAEASPRDRVYTYLEATGSAKAEVIAADLALPLKTVTGILNHKWFARTGDRYTIAKAG